MKRNKTTLVVIHRSERPDEALTSYHFYIRDNGTVMTCLPEDEKGAHAINFNGFSVAVAFEGAFASSFKNAKRPVPTEGQLQAGAALVARLCRKYGLTVAAVKGHTELGAGGTRDSQKLLPAFSCPGDRFPLDAFRARVAALLASLA